MFILSWDEMEVKALLKDIDECIKAQRPVNRAFLNHADKFLRSASSVRDFYYKLIKTDYYSNYVENKELYYGTVGEQLKLNLGEVRQNNINSSSQVNYIKKSNVKKDSSKIYNKNNLDSLVKKIISIKKKEEVNPGVKRVADKLNNNKIELGKYSNVLLANTNPTQNASAISQSKKSKKSKIVDSSKVGASSSVSAKKTTPKNNINKKQKNLPVVLTMPEKKKSLTQSDLNSLFLGLINLMRKSIESDYKAEIEHLKEEIENKNIKIVKLVNLNALLKEQLQAEMVMAAKAKAYAENKTNGQNINIDGLSALKDKLLKAKNQLTKAK